jgi:hypothetical protein
MSQLPKLGMSFCHLLSMPNPCQPPHAAPATVPAFLQCNKATGYPLASPSCVYLPLPLSP